MDPLIKKRRILSVIYEAMERLDSHGDPEFEPPVELLCYPAIKQKMVVNREGVSVVSTIQLYFDTYFLVKEKSEFTVYGDKYPVKAVQPFPGLTSGTGTTVVYL